LCIAKADDASLMLGVAGEADQADFRQKRHTSRRRGRRSRCHDVLA
jgi:hypothetical protein